MAYNRRHLLDRFFGQLRELQPGSVLDVGCGGGGLLELCLDASIAAEGVEADRHVVTAAADRGLVVHEGDAGALPTADGSCDWVTLRHVLHHLENPAAALDEACRVARTGVLVAEPWFDASIPSQALALRVDRWIKRQHQRLGRVHSDGLDANQILALLPVDQDFEADFQYYLRLRERLLWELEEEAAPLLEDLAADAAERVKYEELHEQARQDGLTYNGTMILCLRRRSSF
ncbi:MAG: methyltransferase domain-containing protein [Planctomycetota bacterium]